jgi:hypothetical protein
MTPTFDFRDSNARLLRRILTAAATGGPRLANIRGNC